MTDKEKIEHLENVIDLVLMRLQEITESNSEWHMWNVASDIKLEIKVLMETLIS